MKWINNLKIAIIEKNELRIEELTQSLPNFDPLEKMKEATYIMQEAHNFLLHEKNDMATKILKIKKQKEFIATNTPIKSSFDQSH